MYIGYQLYHLRKLLICAVCSMKLLAIYGTRLVGTNFLHIKQAATTTKLAVLSHYKILKQYLKVLLRGKNEFHGLVSCGNLFNGKQKVGKRLVWDSIEKRQIRLEQVRPWK